jgi:hypothetical protein
VPDFAKSHANALRGIRKNGRPSVTHTKAPSYNTTTGVVTPGTTQVAGYAVILPFGDDATVKASAERWPATAITAKHERALVAHTSFAGAEILPGARLALAAFKTAPACEYDVDAVSRLAPDGRPIMYDCLVRQVAP